MRNKEGQTDLIAKEEIKKNYALGATFEELSEKERRSLNINYGVKIKSITAGKAKISWTHGRGNHYKSK